MTANTGSGLYIRKGYSGSALTTATTFNGSFGVLSGISSTDASTLEYTAVTPDTTKDGDAYTATVNGTEGCGVYYHFELDYMITAEKSLKVTATATAKSGDTAVADKPSIAQATRVGIIEATAYTKETTEGGAASATYKTEGKEYTVAAPATGTDYNLEELKALGYEGTTEYKSGLTALYGDDSNVTFSPTDTKTSDEAFAYGSLSIYVWFDGTDYSCTNAIFSQTLDLTLNFTVVDGD